MVKPINRISSLVHVATHEERNLEPVTSDLGERSLGSSGGATHGFRNQRKYAKKVI